MNSLAVAPTQSDDTRSLCRIGGVAALLVAALTLGEIVGLAIRPQPGTVSGWFSLFQTDKLTGLLDFWVLEIPMYLMFALVFPALHLALGNANRSITLTATVLSFIGVAVFLATNNPFTMMSLSNQYAAATSEAQRSSLIAVGQAVLAATGQRAVGGFNTGLFLVSIAGLVISTVMLQSGPFSVRTAWVGVVAFALSLADYLRQALTSSPMATLLVVMPGSILLIAWFVLVGRKLYQLGAPERRAFRSPA